MRNFHISDGTINVERIKIEAFSNEDLQPHCHDRYEILYVIDGRGKCIIEGVEYPIKPRSVFVFAPFSYFSVLPEEGSVYDRASFKFEKRHIAPSVQEMLSGFGVGDDKVSPAAFYSADDVCDELAALVERFEMAEIFPESEKLLGLLLSELILFVSLAAKENRRYDDSELGARVIRYLNENTDRDISLDKLARKFFVSKYHLCRAFKKHNGISVHGYINRKRVMYAKQLIEAGETASRAAYQVGFGDYSAFYRAYVKIVGKAPTVGEKKN